VGSSAFGAPIRVDNNGELANPDNLNDGQGGIVADAPYNWSWGTNTAGTGRGSMYLSGSSSNGFIIKGETEPQSTESNPIPDGHGILFGGGSGSAGGQSLLYQNITSVAGRHYWMVGAQRINTGAPNNSKPNWGLINGSSTGAGVTPAGAGGQAYGTNVGRNGHIHNGLVATGNQITAQVGVLTPNAGSSNINMWYDGIRVVENVVNVYGGVQNGGFEATPDNITATWDPSGNYGASGVRNMFMTDGWLTMGGGIGDRMWVHMDPSTGKGGTGRSMNIDQNSGWGRTFQFQRVNLGAPQYTLSVDVQSFNTNAGAVVGIDPTGGTDPNSASIIWSNAATNLTFGTLPTDLTTWYTHTLSNIAAADPAVGVTMWLAAGYTGANASSASNSGARFDNVTLVPEPASLGVLALAAVPLLRRRRRST
jgi:hypothetical protein